MKPIHASAPNKIHLAGEHSVVYGGLALMAPVEVLGKRNRITLEVTDVPAGSESFVFAGDLGTATLSPDGTKKGFELYFPMFECVSLVFSKAGFSLSGSGKKFLATLEHSGSPKGTGNSASIPAALAACLYEYFGRKPTKEDLFDAAYAVDNVYHGGKSSGGDPRAVVSDSPLLFKKIFSSTGVSFDYKDAALTLPIGYSLLLVDTFRTGERSNTGVMVSKFAESKKIRSTPQSMTPSEREAIVTPFNSILQKLLMECSSPMGNARTIGVLLDENHGLLRAAGVSSDDIEECLKLGKKAGALGGKLIGAGGNGGAAILFCPNDKLEDITAKLLEEGFRPYPVRFSTRGAGLD